MSVAYDDDGSVMTERIVNTIVPVQFSEEGKEVCLFHMTQIEHGNNELGLDDMLPDSVYDKTTGELTHIMCSRRGYDNTVRLVWSTMQAYSYNGNEWIHDEAFYLEDNPDKELVKSKVGIIIGDKHAVLEYLGLEER